MDQHKKGLALLFMLIAAFSFCSLNVFASSNGSSGPGSALSSQSGGAASSEIVPTSDVPAQGGVS